MTTFVLVTPLTVTVCCLLTLARLHLELDEDTVVLGKESQHLIEECELRAIVERHGAQLLLGHILHVLIDARGTLERIVVLQDNLSVLRDAHIELKGANTRIEALLEGREHIFHTLATAATVGKNRNLRTLSVGIQGEECQRSQQNLLHNLLIINWLVLNIEPRSVLLRELLHSYRHIRTHKVGTEVRTEHKVGRRVARPKAHAQALLVRLLDSLACRAWHLRTYTLDTQGLSHLYRTVVQRLARNHQQVDARILLLQVAQTAVIARREDIVGIRGLLGHNHRIELVAVGLEHLLGVELQRHSLHLELDILLVWALVEDCEAVDGSPENIEKALQ